MDFTGLTRQTFEGERKSVYADEKAKNQSSAGRKVNGT